MLDINVLRDFPEKVIKTLEKRQQPEKISLVNHLIKEDSLWRSNLKKLESLKQTRNELTHQIIQFKKEKKDSARFIKEAKELPEKIKELEESTTALKKKIDEELLQIPNILDQKVPLGKSEKDNPVIKTVGKPKSVSFNLLSHIELVENLGLADFEAGRTVAGKGFNYLKGDLALLDHSLQRYGVDYLLKKGFTLVVPPMLLNFESLRGALNGLKDFEEVIYKVEKEDLYLIGTAEHSLVSMFKDKTLQKDDLPLKVCALTPCFRKEIGAHGVDTKGLFRMHQFNKVEQVMISPPEKSEDNLEEMQKITESFFKSLEIPFRVIEICSADLGAKFSRQYDIEAWFPRQKEYKEVTSAGNCTDYQSRALNIKFYDKGNRVYPHLLNNTMVATSRAMVCILENYQQRNGTIKVPKVLQPYMGNKKVIGEKNG